MDLETEKTCIKKKITESRGAFKIGIEQVMCQLSYKPVVEGQRN